MSVVYDKWGVRFIYPEGWKITEDQTNERPRTLSLESPAGGTWELLLYDDHSSPDELVADALEAMRKEYDDVESSAWTDCLDEVEVVGCEMYFYYLDLLIHCRAMAAPLGDQTALFLWQAEDRTFTELEAVFRAITICLLNPQKYSTVE